MFKVLRSVSLCLALGMSAPSWATASFANRELGLGWSAFGLIPSAGAKVPWGVSLVTLDAGIYLDNGFGLYLHVPIWAMRQLDGALKFGTGGQLGVRYLFLEESVRPYVMLHLAGFYIFRDAAIGPQFFTGPGAGAGVDFFVVDSVSIGLRATVDLYLTLTTTDLVAQACLGGGIYATTYF